MDIFQLRHEYLQKSLGRNDLCDSPFDQFQNWFDEALKADILEPNAMALASASTCGTPSCRMVLMKNFDSSGIFFFTNLYSRKGVELTTNPRAAVTFWWKELDRQVHVQGSVETVSREYSKYYFSQRPKPSQIGTRSSRQGETIPSRQFLKDEHDRLAALYADTEVPLPADWGGFKIVPHQFEFWQGRENRIHDRFCYVLQDGEWKIARLSP